MDIMQENEKKRISLNMNINQYAKHLGLNQPTYYRLLNNQANIQDVKIKTFLLLLHLLDKKTQTIILDELSIKILQKNKS